MGTLKRLAVLGLMMGTLSACEQTTEPQIAGNCVWVGLLKADGLFYRVTDRLDGADALSPGAYVATTTRKRDFCQDVIVASEDGSLQTVEPIEDGDANFLEPGTRLYELPGHPPSERLVADGGDGWYLLRAIGPVDGLIENGVQVRLFLDWPRVTPPGTLTARLQYNVSGFDRRTVTSPSACPATLGVYRGETLIPFPTTEDVCATVVTRWELTPADSLIREWSLEIGPDGVPLEPGAYRIVVDLNTHDHVLEVGFDVR